MLEMQVRTEGQLLIHEKLAKIAHPDLTPLLQQIADVLKADADAARLGGEGRFNAFDDIAESTARRRQRGRNPRGDGPPLRPDDTSSFAEFEITNFEASEGYGLVAGGWPMADSFIRHHVEGRSDMPARDPLYVSDETWAKIHGLIRQFYLDIIQGG